jgi:hypothetical protein
VWIWFVPASGAGADGAIEVDAEVGVGIGDAPDGVADAGGDGLAGAFGGGPGKCARPAVGSGGAA